MKKMLNRKNILTAAFAVALYGLIFLLVQTGALSRHFQSLLVPVGINVILAVSLNLTVGFLGELTPVSYTHLILGLSNYPANPS